MWGTNKTIQCITKGGMMTHPACRNPRLPTTRRCHRLWRIEFAHLPSRKPRPPRGTQTAPPPANIPVSVNSTLLIWVGLGLRTHQFGPRGPDGPSSPCPKCRAARPPWCTPNSRCRMPHASPRCPPVHWPAWACRTDYRLVHSTLLVWVGLEIGDSPVWALAGPPSPRGPDGRSAPCPKCRAARPPWCTPSARRRMPRESPRCPPVHWSAWACRTDCKIIEKQIQWNTLLLIAPF